jgi:hypothetical protein
MADDGKEPYYTSRFPGGTCSVRLRRSVNSVLTKPDVQEALAQLAYGVPAQPNTPETFSRLIDEEAKRWTAILRERNIRPLH